MSGCGGSCATRSTAVEGSYLGVRFADEALLTLCLAPADEALPAGAAVVVEVDGEPTLGQVESSPQPIYRSCCKRKARPILRRATPEDRQAGERQRATEVAAKLFCQERARAQKLEMKVSRVAFSLNGRRATVYFTAESRVDFRQLVREVAQRFSTRVQMAQVGARDEAKLLGGIGVCGLALCCSDWLTEFKPISIQMAKRQSLSLNPAKISGQCGRLLCCLAYEDEDYRKGGSRRPGPALPVDA